jgi:hypothetical protein
MTISFLVDIYPVVGLLNCIILFLVFLKTPINLSVMAVHTTLHFHHQCTSVLFPPHPHHPCYLLSFLCLFVNSYSGRCDMMDPHVLICISLIDVVYLFLIFLLAYCLLLRMSVQVPCPFSNQVILFSCY